MNIDPVWRRIVAHEGETFTQIRGATFCYKVMNNCISPDRTNRLIPRSDIEKALEHVPLLNTMPVQRLQGPSYIYAILMDPRIRQGLWSH